MGVIRWLLVTTVMFILLVFGVNNMEMIDLKFAIAGLFAYEVQLPLFAIIFVAVIAGIVVAGLFGLSDHLRMYSRLRKQNKAVERLENEVKTLRNLPLEEEGEDGMPAGTSSRG